MKFQRKDLSRSFFKALAALPAVLLLLSTAVLAAPTLRAVPQTVTIPPAQTSGKATITWDAGAANPEAEVWLQIDNGDEERFSGEAKGTQAAVIEAGKRYTFKLYNDKNGENVLATVVVTGKAAGGAADAPPPDDAAPPDNGGAMGGAPDDGAPDGGAAAGSFTGAWNTIAGGTHEYTVTLKQVGNTVTGSFSPGNGKIFEGVVVGKKLTFKWTQDGGWEGTGEFTLDEDGKGFTGSSTALKPQQFTNTWNSFVPEPADFAGTWETTSNNAQFTLMLQQVGTTVIGTYTPGNGKIEGTVKDNILRFKWTSDGGKGSGRFVMYEDEMAFTGSYSNGEDPDKADGTWRGTRKVGGGGGKAPPVSFAGTWNLVSSSGSQNVLKIQQTGSQATGSYGGARRRSPLEEATIAGRTLRFKVTRGGKVTTTGEVVMDEDGKSLKGTINGKSVTGTLVQP